MFRVWCVLILSFFVAIVGVAEEEKRWFKGNTHTHTLWSDGDAAPELVVDWYKSHGFDFLCISEHNIFAAGHIQRWYPISEQTHLTPERVQQLRERFGDDSVETKHEHGRDYMRLKTLPELQDQFEEAGSFLMIPAQEITSNYPPIHVNAINIRELAPAVNFVDTQEGFVANLEFIRNQGKRFGVPTFAHFNHPNWSEGYRVEDTLPIDGPLTFEIFNGHPYVLNFGDAERHMVSNDRFWDIMLAIRLKRDPKNILYGIGVSDSHEYFKIGPKEANPGRGWTMVRATELTPEALIESLNAGDFYASSGVMLKSVESDAKSYTVSIEAEPGAEYETVFIGTRKGFDDDSTAVLDDGGKPRDDVTRQYSDEIGEVLLRTTDNPATYAFSGDEMYVRAKVVSSKELDNPFQEGGTQMAWTQPVLVGR